MPFWEFLGQPLRHRSKRLTKDSLSSITLTETEERTMWSKKRLPRSSRILLKRMEC
jgi:hypothetical protein